MLDQTTVLLFCDSNIFVNVFAKFFLARLSRSFVPTWKTSTVAFALSSLCSSNVFTWSKCRPLLPAQWTAAPLHAQVDHSNLLCPALRPVNDKIPNDPNIWSCESKIRQSLGSIPDFKTHDSTCGLNNCWIIGVYYVNIVIGIHKLTLSYFFFFFFLFDFFFFFPFFFFFI